ncbi:SRPBCC domain-containing protein [Agrococcus sp. SL85]|uniref:SRPBCC family protein n=1 Tax=Agrococcus sp. SL85 TaxID=2995141 RepID=UPI00226CED5D|nr:SRPBCC domain-containing protein [Agrococcus sp. SL85]WAC65113.1 SRPBCC domain-containing protein [Agrococcus sp. SL85]
MAELVVEQAVPAGREVVWAAWTDPAAIARWWWRAIPGTSIAAEAREGGRYRFDAGAGFGVRGEYRALAPHERLVLTWQWIDEGRPEPEVDEVEVLLAEAVGGTLVTVRHTTREAARDAYEEGWRDTLAHLPGACA